VGKKTSATIENFPKSIKDQRGIEQKPDDSFDVAIFMSEIGNCISCSLDETVNYPRVCLIVMPSQEVHKRR